MNAQSPSPLPTKAMSMDALAESVRERFGCEAVRNGKAGITLTILPKTRQALPELCRFLFWDCGCGFGGLVVEERTDGWLLSYLFLARGGGWLNVLVELPPGVNSVPSISAQVHAADWHEREAEDLFGLQFENHPRLGDFVLHDQIWPEGIAPQRKQVDASRVSFERRPSSEWRPLLVVQDPGAFAMPVGPVYEGGVGEPLHFMLETVGEDVVRAVPRLFYKYRGVEKIAEGRTVDEALLLAERFAATSSFAHSMAFCQAVERIWSVEVPSRAAHLRILLAELERLRHHAGTITGICGSTALAVAASHAAMIEEELLRVSCRFTGHRYLFGLNVPGGLRRDFEKAELYDLRAAVEDASKRLHTLEERLYFTSSFLDRLEDVGKIGTEKGRDLNLLGPVGRASANGYDLRRDCPYNGYAGYEFEVARVTDGDGHARLRVLFQEAYQSARLIAQAVERMEPGPVMASATARNTGAALGWVEAPIGAAMHWVRLNENGRIERYHAMTSSFNNWMGFHAAVEAFAFQDFPIILATFGLSAAECDR